MREWQQITGVFWHDVGGSHSNERRTPTGSVEPLGSESPLNMMWVCFCFQVTELECQSNQTPVIKSQKTELNQTIEELENTLRDKEEVCARVFSGGRPVIYHLKSPVRHLYLLYVSSRKWKS